MTDSLSSRIAAAKAAAEADRIFACEFCRATDDLVPFVRPHAPSVLVCADEDACHDRFLSVVEAQGT